MTSFERVVKNVFQRFGILIRKYNASTAEDLRRIKLLKHYHIDLVFDIGANKGQYAQGIIDAGYKNKIVSFEPLSAVHKIISDKSLKYGNWTVAPRCAVGARSEKIEINISSNSVSSTLLTMLDTHYEGDPDSKIIGKEEVEVFPLDEIGVNHIGNAQNIFIKMDVQGFEQEVIKGATNFFSKAVGVEMEISLVPLYKDQNWLLPEIISFMDAKNYTLVSIAPAFTNLKTGQMLQCNGIFIRKSHLK